MNIKSTSLDTSLPAGAGVGPKGEQTEGPLPEGYVDHTPPSAFAGLPNFSVSRPVIAVERAAVLEVQVVEPFWIVDTDGDLVRRSAVIAIRVDRANSWYKVVGVTERMVFTFANFTSADEAAEYRLALAKAIAG